MADRKITELTALAVGGQATGDLLTIVDVSETVAVDKNKKITMENLFKGIPGDVGIGTSSPSSPLHISSSEDSLLLLQSSDANAYLAFQDPDSSSNAANRVGTVSNGLYFNTGGGGERMRIDSSGRVGIGSTSPSSFNGSADNLVIQSDGDTGLTITATSSTSSSIHFADGTNGNASYRGIVEYKHGNDALVFYSSATERMRIDSSGNIGIGESNPDTRIHVKESSSTSTGIFIQNSNGGINSSADLYFGNWSGSSTTTPQARISAIHKNVNTHATDLAVSIYDGVNTLERMRIDSSGRVGIGTTSPTSYSSSADELVVAGTTNPGITIAGSADNTGTIMFADGTSGSEVYRGQIDYQHASDAMVFFTNGGSERMRIDSSGKVKIGLGSGTIDSNQSYGSSIEVQNSTKAGNFYTTASAGGYSAITCGRGNNGSVFESFFGTTLVGTISVNSSSTTYGTSSDYRLKENVVDLDGAITRVKQLLPKRFNFIVDADTTVDGFLAHEAQTVVPEAVTGTHNQVDDDGNAVMQQIDQSKLVPLLTAALQEAIAKIETLETKVAALEAQ